ncbi:MAG: hypothetical protein PVG39_02005, partial [Desulfobacteraceae bacterium]
HFSLPVYLYPYLNGARSGDDFDTRFTDNNGGMSQLLHISPEFYLSGNKIKLLGSIGYGKWDDDDDKSSIQYSMGMDLTVKRFNFSGEYLFRERQKIPLLGGGTSDGEDKGYYLRALYIHNNKWRVMAKYSDIDQFFISNTMLTDNYQAFSFSFSYWLTEGSTIIPQIDAVDAERSDGSEKLEYLRYTLGWRTTF